MEKQISTRRFHVTCNTWNSFSRLYQKNICHGFLFLGINAPALDPAPLVVQLHLPGGHKLSLPGQPVRVQPLSDGQRLRLVVKLEPISEENKQLMLALFDIARLDREPSSPSAPATRSSKPTPPPLPPRARVRAMIHR